VKSRNADILFITDDNHQGTLEENVIQIETNHNFGGILANIILQILSYEISLLKNIHPDYPRNLAKVVTVE
jgi:glucosamine--fructose-6-phosphate aminotransferase (isomerizing)